MPQPKLKALADKPRFERGGIARGLKAGAGPAALKAVDPEGGDEKAGIIRGMAVITRGEALGHRLWIDRDMLQSTAAAINASRSGAKARFTHPDVSSDGLGKFTGRVKNASVDGDVVRGDLHFSQTSHETPDGDLAAYLMHLAETDPEAFGNSIVFEHDYDAEAEFMMEHGATVDEYGYVDFDEFESPDKDNAENYPHARLKELRAVDAVDEPAANPAGMFHRGQQIVQDAESLLAFSLGITKQRPALSTLEIDPERASGFIVRFLDRHGLAIVPKEKGPQMPPAKLNDGATDNPPKDEGQKTETAPAAEGQGEGDGKKEPEKKKEGEASGSSDSGNGGQTQTSEAPGAKFLKAFGQQGGVWFAEGKTFEQAQELHTKHLQSENERLAKENTTLKAKVAPGRGEETPLSGGTSDKKKLSVAQQNLGPSLSKFADTIKLPGER